MNWLLDNWKTKNKIESVIQKILQIIRLLIVVAFFIIPWMWSILPTFKVFKWLWLGCAVVMVDSFVLPSKKEKENKTIFVKFPIFTIWLSAYLLGYWKVLSLTIVICANIIIAVMDFTIQASRYKMIKFTDKCKKPIILSDYLIKNLWVSSFYIAVITLFICGILESRVLTFVFGGISALMLAVSIVLNISKGLLEKKDAWGLTMFIADILSALAIIAYLIYLISPNEESNLQTIVLTLVASLIGGTLTLSGVAWTIIHTANEKHKDDIAKAKPLFTFNKLFHEPIIIEGTKACFDSLYGDEVFNMPVYFEIENSNQAVFNIVSVYHDDKWYKFIGDTVVLPNNKVLVHFRFNQWVNGLFLEVKDGLGNSYYYHMKVLAWALMPSLKVNENSKLSHTIHDLEEVSFDEVQKTLSEFKKV